MKCLNKSILTRYFDRQFPAEKVAIIEEHLDTCPVCAEELKRIGGEVAFVDSKLTLLRPDKIPQKEFDMPDVRRDKSHAMKALRQLFGVSVRVPITVMMILFVILAALIVGLILQNRELSRVKKPYLVAKQQAEFILLDGVAEGFEPVEEPRIFVAREENE